MPVPVFKHEVRHRNIEDLKTRANNPRTHADAQIEQIAKLIRRLGFVTVIVIDEHDRIIAGHARLEAAKRAGLTRVPTVCAHGWSETDIRLFLIADNQVAANAGWDEDLLKLEFKELAALDPELDLTLTGFSVGAIDLLLQDGAALDEPALPDPPGEPVTRPGDIFACGVHLVGCFDTTKDAAYAALLKAERARLVVTDPPYNVPIRGHVTSNPNHREFAMASGEMSFDEHQHFLARQFSKFRNILVDGGLAYVSVDWRGHLAQLTAARAVGLEHLATCVWKKSNPGMGSFYRSQHEFFDVFKSGSGKHVNNVELGKHGRNRSNVWEHPGMSSFSAERDALLALHPTVKPTALFADIVLDASRRDETVVDPFLGSGTTVLAAERTGRRCVGIEIDPAYVDVALARWAELTGEDPVRADGATFSSLKRAQEAA